MKKNSVSRNKLNLEKSKKKEAKDKLKSYNFQSYKWCALPFSFFRL